MTRAAFFLLLVGCTGTPSATEGTTGATSGAGGHGVGANAAVGGHGARGGHDGGGSDAGGAPPHSLVDRGLVARYFIDEAARGTAPDALEDAAPEPLALPLGYDEAMAFGEREGHRGLVFSAKEQDGAASTPIADTKFFTRLSGKTTATLEVVVALDDASISQSRLLHVGSGTESGRLTISTPLVDRVHLFWRGSERLGAFAVDLGPARVVLHAVIDTTAPADLRARAFANGAPLPRIGGTIPGEGAGIVLEGDEALVIGNRAVGERSPEGAILYAAIYDAALDDAEVLHNARRLLASDDAPNQTP